MSDISRRNFLFGTVAAAAAGTALVLQSDDRAIKLFEPTLQETLAVSRIPKAGHIDRDPWGIGDILYSAAGIPVMYVSSYAVGVQVDSHIDVTLSGDLHEEFEHGIRRKRGISVHGYPIQSPFEGLR